ncbi:MAG TPA: MBOAT family O-acyltransferase [Anaerolineaceae bacterium]|nr:MBOAT family O-acyltransferase [Anaerolineaceae bacterium]
MDYLNPVLLLPALGLLCALVYLFPARLRWVLLLVASYAFYFWIGKWAILVLMALTVLNYFLALAIERATPARAKTVLILGILLNVAALAFFKYGNVLSAQTGQAASFKLLLPLGMSFFTLQHIAYLVDVKKGLIPAERNLGIFAAFMAFFPKIASGPIERGRKLLPQLHQPKQVNSDEVLLGFRQVVFGLFKKVVIADRLALIVNQVFDNVGTYNGITILYSMLFLTFQIYLDFSGYTDIALGAARLMGIELTPNFKRPYLATDVAEFWNRWHLSFSTWLRDYIFYPLRRFLLQHHSAQALALVLPPLVTMLLSGAWHGVGWNFIAWGLYHAIFYIISLWVKDMRKLHPPRWPGLLKAVDILVNFLVVSAGWVIFRLDSFTQIKRLFSSISWANFINSPFRRNSFEFDFEFGLLFIVLVVVWEVLQEVTRGRLEIDKLPTGVRWLGYFLILLAITTLGVFDYTGNPFIYFKF